MMKRCARMIRIFCWILGIVGTAYVFIYAHYNPTDQVGIYLRFPIVMIAIKMIPFPGYNWKKRKKVFVDNIEAFREYEQQRQLHFSGQSYISFHSKKEGQHADSPEGALVASLINYISKEDLADDEPYVRIRSRKWGKGLEVCIRCTWYRKFIFYWIPENEIAIFENFRFNKTVRIEENWFLIV